MIVDLIKGLNHHFVIVVAGSGSNPAGYTINDPWDGQVKSLSSYTNSSWSTNGLRIYGGTPWCQSSTCPQSGGVLLYWNADYNCNNNESDAGYRLITSTGLHNVNDGAFNDDASSLKVPSGWSVILHEHENGGGGESNCYSSDVPDFGTIGNFLWTSTPINDHVSSVTVYDNTDCSENPPPQPGPGDWYVEYFSDTTLTNRCSPPNQIASGPFAFQDWGDGSPYAGCPSDNWSARFWRTVHFQSGTYTFGLGSDDWSRIIVAGDTVVNNWQGAGQHYETRSYQEGDRNVTVEFADTLGSAKLAAWWWGPGFTMPRETRDPYQWYTQYWGNKDLWWDSVIRVNEGTGSLNHDWGSNGPGYGLPVDKFSSRFERQVYLSCSKYRFHITNDNGVRFWVDEQLKLDQWSNQVGTYDVDVDLLSGNHELKIEHFEDGGAAHLSLDWNQIGGCSDTTYPTGSITAPTAGAVISTCPLPIQAEASDVGSGVNLVEFHAYFDDGWHHLGDDASSPYSLSWDCSSINDQGIWLTIHVIDNAGNETMDPGGYVYITLNRNSDIKVYLPVMFRNSSKISAQSTPTPTPLAVRPDSAPFQEAGTGFYR